MSLSGQYEVSIQHSTGQHDDAAVSTLEAGDYVVLLFYFVIVIGTGIVSSLKNRGSVGGYFLAGQSVNWLLVGLSLFASNIGSGHFVGLAGNAASNGISVAAFELHAVYTLTMLGWLFAPVYKSSGVYTLPEYLFKRFGGKRIRMYLAVMSLLLYVFTKIAADLFAGALFLTQSIPSMNLYLAIIILISISAVFTITGGLTAVIWTDAVQTVIMVLGALILMILSFNEVGGYANIRTMFPKAVSDSWLGNQSNPNYTYKKCGRPDDYYFNIMRPPSDPDLPWTGLVFGLTVSAVWYWCSDQVIVQRVLAAKNMMNVKLACVLASYLKVTPMFLIVFPGMISRILFPNKIACNDPNLCEQICKSRKSCSNIAYPTLVLEIMPTGLRGLLLSVMMSALISSLTSVFNSTATIFTIDVWCNIRKGASDVELMVVGRLVVVVLVVVSVLWIPVIQNAKELFQYIQSITSFLAPPVCAVFVLAVFWNRCTEGGAFWGLLVGLVIGMIRFIWQFVFYSKAACGEVIENDWPKHDLIEKLHSLNFGAVLFSIVVIFTVAVSLSMPRPPESSYMGMTFFTRKVPGEMGKAYFTTYGDPHASDQHQREHPKFFQDLLAGRTFAELPLHIKMVLWFCGVEDLLSVQTTEEQAKAPPMDRTVWEPESMKWVLHAHGILAIIIITLTWAYYG